MGSSLFTFLKSTGGLAKIVRVKDFIVYPNPTKGTITVEFTGLQKEIRIIQWDIFGRIVTRSNFKSTRKASVLIQGPPGIYYLDVKINDENTGKFKIIKNTLK